MATRTALAVAVGMAAAVACLVVWVLTHRPKPHAAAAADPAAGTVTPQVEALPCWFEVPADRTARCGALAEGAAAAGVPVTIRYVVFEAGPGAAPDPIVYINGGPGSAVGIDAAGATRWWRLSRTVFTCRLISGRRGGWRCGWIGAKSIGMR